MLVGLLTLQRNSELRGLKWADIQDGVWQNHITKTELPLRCLRQHRHRRLSKTCADGTTPTCSLASSRDGTLSVVAPMNYLRGIGYDTKTEISLHGFRAMGRTLLVEELEYPEQWIEHQLAHMPRAVHGRAYDRAKYLKQRTAMMQHWADWLADGS